MKNTLIIMIFCIAFCTQACADSKTIINDINIRVADIEKTKAGLNALELKLHTGEFEPSPPEVKFFYKQENMELVALQVSVGHETFVTKYSYYFDNNNIIKYLKETLHHPDSPPKQAVIYDGHGIALWKNTDEPVFDHLKIIELFKLNMQSLKSFSKY